MATIDDLNIPDFADMSQEELMELIKHTRQRRRTPPPEVREQTRKKAEAKQKRGKAIALQDVNKFTENLSPEQAMAILKEIQQGSE